MLLIILIVCLQAISSVHPQTTSVTRHPVTSRSGEATNATVTADANTTSIVTTLPPTTPAGGEAAPDGLLAAPTDILQGLTDQIQSLEAGVASPADFERSLSKVDLLALKVDDALMSSLDQWLSKYGIQMPASLLKTIEQMDLCPDSASDGLQHYCTKMPDGQYYDPWNPWCGYITCTGGVASRAVCRPGTWMGEPRARTTGHSTTPTNVLMTMDRMCRRQLTDPILGSVCAQLTDSSLCRSAAVIATQHS